MFAEAGRYENGNLRIDLSITTTLSSFNALAIYLSSQASWSTLHSEVFPESDTQFGILEDDHDFHSSFNSTTSRPNANFSRTKQNVRRSSTRCSYN